jgi:RNA polymerase sigma-70 factor (ECF subfamily)
LAAKTDRDPGVSTLAIRERPIGAETDRADAALAASGETVAFERLYRRHVAHIHSLCRRMVGDADEDDLAQEVFVRAWRKLGQFRGESAFSTWLYRLAVNVILARRQTIGSYRSRFGGGDPAELQVPARHMTHELRIDFESAIQRLPPGARDVFVLHDIEGYTHEEIGAMLEVTPGTSKSQLHRARMALREHLGHERSRV